MVNQKVLGAPVSDQEIANKGYVDSAIVTANKTYIQQTEPTPGAGTGSFIWYVTDVSGNVTDIRYGVA